VPSIPRPFLPVPGSRPRRAENHTKPGGPCHRLGASRFHADPGQGEGDPLRAGDQEQGVEEAVGGAWTCGSTPCVATADLVAAPGYHLVLVHDGEQHIENWIAFLESVAARTDVDTVLTGHGPDTDLKGAAVGIDP
jgi:hypothetical protein